MLEVLPKIANMQASYALHRTYKGDAGHQSSIANLGISHFLRSSLLSCSLYKWSSYENDPRSESRKENFSFSYYSLTRRVIVL